MEKIKELNKERLNRIISSNDKKADDWVKDQNMISSIIVMKHLLRIVRIVFILFNTCYFLGIFWFIALEMYKDRYLDDVYSTGQWGVYVPFCDLPDGVDAVNSPNTFLHQHRLICHYDDVGRNIIVLSYFFLTTLSSVGFGDYHPRNDFERICCTVVFLFGCMIFGYILGNYGEIIYEYNNLTADLDDGDKLARFFGLLKHFNDGEEMNYEL